VLQDSRQRAPATLTEAEAVIWAETVGVMPSGWLTRAQTPLLVAYCRHAARSDLLAQQVNRFRPAWLKEAGGIERFNRLLVMAERETKAMTSAARSLRLTPQSQYGPRKGARLSDDAVSLRKPWDPAE
jgi:hypothetical protein